MLLVGESINVMTKRLRIAMRKRDPKPIAKVAVAQAKAGMDYLDVNLGPAKRDGPELMAWIVEVVQQETGLPLFLDTSNVEAIEAGLAVHEGTAVVNSISCRPERMDALFPVIAKHDADFVALLIGTDGIPRDADERAMLAAEMQMRMAEEGVAEERAFFDPIVLPVTSQQDQVQGCTGFMMVVKDLIPGAKVTCGLSNVSNGAPEDLRPILNQTYMAMLMKFGLDSAIVNAAETDLTDIARGEREDVLSVVHAVMDGEDVDDSSLSPELLDYAKTTRVLLGQSLYSHSWLSI